MVKPNEFVPVAIFTYPLVCSFSKEVYYLRPKENIILGLNWGLV